MQRRRLTLGHRNLRNPRCGFELINVSANFRRHGSLTVKRHLLRRHGRACPGHDQRDFVRGVVQADEKRIKMQHSCG
jgi:hypothetical protein